MSAVGDWSYNNIGKLVVGFTVAILLTLVILIVIAANSPEDCAHVTITGTMQGFTTSGHYVYGTTTMERDATSQERAACLARQKKG